MKLRNFVWASALLVSIGACVPEGMMESDPVTVPTNYGNITCQLYSKDINWWDRSISYPRGMTQQSADQLCFEVGTKISRGESIYSR